MCHFNLLHIQTLGEFILIFYEDNKHVVRSVKIIHSYLFKNGVVDGAVSFKYLSFGSVLASESNE